MAAGGLFIIYLIYFVLSIVFLACLILLIVSKKNSKILSFILCAFSGCLLFTFKSCQDDHYKDNQMSEVGIYYLPNYPNCKSCYVELKEDMTYRIMSNNEEIKSGTWHNESGGDFSSTYLDNDNNQMGSGDLIYHDFKLKYSDIGRQLY